MPQWTFTEAHSGREREYTGSAAAGATQEAYAAAASEAARCRALVRRRAHRGVVRSLRRRRDRECPVGTPYWMATAQVRGYHYEVLTDLEVALQPGAALASFDALRELPRGHAAEHGGALALEEGIKVGDAVKLVEHSDACFTWSAMSEYDARELRREVRAWAAAGRPAGGGAAAALRQAPRAPAAPRAAAARDDARQRGNAALRRGDLANARRWYTDAIAADRKDTRAYGNRSLVHLRMQRWREAASDAETVLGFEPRNVKALMRRAAAREGTREFDWALEDLRAALRLEPGNAEIEAAIRRVEAKEAAPPPAAVVVGAG